MGRWRTRNCHEEQHDRCTGGLACDCPCHEIPAPPNLRELAGLTPKPEPEEDR